MCLIPVRLLRQIVAAETLRDVLAQGIQGFIRNANAVRTDVADDTLRALAFKVYAFKSCRETPIVPAILGNDAGIYGSVRLIVGE